MGDALHTHGGVTSAQEARVADAGLLALQGPGVFDVRTGVLAGPGTTELVTGTSTAAPSWTYQIAAHNWVTSRGAANGPYRGALEAPVTVDTDLPPASNSRIDVIWVKQGDATAGVPTPDAATAPEYGCTSGTAAPSPVKPAIPVGAVEIATAVVPSTATGGTAGAGTTITQTALQTAARGGIVPVRNQAERDALTTYPGMPPVVRLDTGQLEFYRAGEWRTVPSNDDTGWQSLAAGASAGWSSPAAADTPARYRRIGNRTFMDGLLRTDSGTTAPQTASFVTLPAEYWPSSEQWFTVAGWVNGGVTDPYVDELRVATNGVVTLVVKESRTGTYLSGISWLTD